MDAKGLEQKYSFRWCIGNQKHGGSVSLDSSLFGLVKYMYYVVIRLQPDFADFAPEIKSYKSRRLCLFVSGERGGGILNETKLFRVSCCKT